MANIGNGTIFIGSPDWYIGDPESYVAVADYIDPKSAQYGLNSTARFIVTGAYSPDPLGDPLFFDWEVTSAPAKSLSFIKPNEEEARLEIDVVGVYTISLLVSGANGGASTPLISLVVGQPASVAYNGGLEYDVSWIWRTLSDFWSTMSTQDRSRIEAIWSAVQSLVSADLMDLFNVKDSIAVNTLQANVFRKWQAFDTTLDVSDARVLLGLNVGATSNTSAETLKITIPKVQQRYAAKLIKNNTLLVPGVIPQSFDVGRAVKITNKRTGYLSDVKITGVGKTSAGIPTFTIPTQSVASSDLPLEYDMRLFAPTHQPGIFVKVGESFFISSQGGDGYLEVALENSAHLPTTLPIQVRIEGAEVLGVMPTDVIEIAIRDQTSNKSILVHADVLAVSGDLVAIEPSRTLKECLEELYSVEEATLLQADIQDVGWRARYMGSWLGPETVYQIGVGGIYAKNLVIQKAVLYRRNRLLISDDVRTLFRLTTNTTRMVEGSDGVFTPTGNLIPTPPLELYENVDFYIRKVADRGYRLSTQTLNTFIAEGYDFSLARIREGSTLVVTTGLGTGSYTITSVSGAVVQVSPASRIAFVDSEFYIESENAYIEFHSTALQGSLVPKLWAEYAVYDNGARIQDAFGYGVGLSREFWESLNNRSTYKDAVASIIKARVTSSTVESLDNVISLALGIPVAPYRSVIRDIDYEYRLDPYGVPSEVHVTLEEVSETGTKTGRITTHDVSADNDFRLSSTAGMALNPSTGSKYQQGDLIEQYTSIGEGVRVIDLYTTDITFALNDILDRHRFAVLIDVDSVAGLAANPEKLSLTRSLIFETKPSYTTFFVRLLKYLVDFIDIEDDLFIKMISRVYDNPYHHRGPANIYDDYIPGISDRDAPPMLPLTTWFPRDGEITSIDVNAGTFVLTSQSGGFIKPTENTGALRFNPTGVYPWIEQGDYVEIVAETWLKLVIIGVLDDTRLAVQVENVEDKIQLLALPSTEVRFFVYRILRDHTVRSSINIPIDGDRLTLDFIGQSSTNLGLGDLITLQTDTGESTGRLRILETELDAITDKFTVRTYPPVRGLPLESVGTVRVFRESIRDRVFTGEAQYPALFEALVESPYIEFVENAYTVGVDVGDILDIDGHAQSKIVGISGRRVFTEHPIPNFLGPKQVTCYRVDTNVGADDLDEQELAVASSVQIRLSSIVVAFGKNGRVRIFNGLGKHLSPGDILLTGHNLDLGEGAGVFRLCSRRNTDVFETNVVGLSEEVIGSLRGEFKCSLTRQDEIHSDYFFHDSSLTVPTWGNVRIRP